MKKILTSLVTVATMATVSNADLARVEMGMGVFSQTPTGTISYSDLGLTGTYASNKNKTNNMYVWLLIKHPVPALPNLRLEYTSISDSGPISGNFGDFSITTGSTSAANITMGQFDIIPYYNILDNTFWATLDLGLDIKIAQTDYSISPITNLTGTPKSLLLPVPLLYARARSEVPATNIAFESDVKFITYGKSTIYDIRVKADYTLDFIPVIQPALEVGYRIQKFDLTSSDSKSKMNLDFSGIYVGLMARF